MDLDSVILVIKAPNQRFEDHTVECMLGWTVGKLKQHLQDVYPSKPKLHHQKLIYSGKLLKDDLTLKEVLHKYEDGSNRHTVHLVCSPTFTSAHLDNYHSNVHDKDKQETSWSPSETSGSQSFVESDVLRYRGPQGSFSAVSGNYQNVGHTMPQIPQYPSVPMMPAAGMITQEQYLYMQQAYAQYMAQYMQQYYQAGWNQQQQTHPSTSAIPGQTVNQNQDNERVAANENVRMDAGAGGAVVDDDDEFGQRDWLDYIYTFSRLVVLIGIVYFYSTPSRFLMVLVCFFAVYLYQAGWFPLRRENNNQQQQNQQQQNQHHHQQVQEGSDQPVVNRENPAESEENISLAQPNSHPVVAGPSVLSVMWTFISTFFVSLVPQQPPAVNAN